MLYVITSKKLCADNFLTRIENIARSRPDRLIYREKELSPAEYRTYAYDCRAICRLYDVPFSINSNIELARELCVDLHVPVQMLIDEPSLAQEFRVLGASVHSAQEAKKAEELGADYVIAGHIFPTECKKGVLPRGLAFLKEVCDRVSIPVLAVGGISKERINDAYSAGADGICVMSRFMQCDMDALEGELFSFKKTK